MDNAELVAALDALPEKNPFGNQTLGCCVEAAGISAAPAACFYALLSRLPKKKSVRSKLEQALGRPRTDITDGGEYIHAVRRGTRQP